MGAYYAAKAQDKAVSKIIKSEILKVVQIIKRKRISDQIAAYVIKKVLLPRIEYRMQNTFLTEQQCEKLSSLYFGAFKHILSLARTAPNTMITMPYPYDIKSVRDLQRIAHTNTLINCLNNTSVLGKLLVYASRIFK